jgi:hypothetical protein
MLVARITLPHFSVSSAMNFEKSAGEPPSAVAPDSESRALTLGSAKLAFTALLTLATASGGIPFGPSMPVQKLA